MVATIQQMIGKVNFSYSENGKDLLEEYGSYEKIPPEKIKAKPLVEHKLVYDSATEQLEPVYFFILDLMNDFGMGTEKLLDNFTSSPGSGHFSELGQRSAVMQQQGFKVMGDINTILRSVLNIIYDLKDFRTRLAIYNDFHSKDKATSEAARLSLKQIWLDKVDIGRGQGSIHAMATGQLGFQTLRDAFLAVRDEKLKDSKGNEIDLNDRVKRILRARILEFNTWLEHSEGELKKRYNLEKTYLKSQVNSLKLYSRWAKPYLKAAQSLEMKEGGREAALVKTFNTIILELSIFGKNKIKVDEEALAGNFPAHFAKLKLKRDYFSCVLVDFRFRGIPQRVAQQQHYAFGGRAEITFSAYALNSDELDKLNEELGKSDVGDALKLIEGTTTESLDVLQKEINDFLEEKEKKKKEKKKSDSGANPFLALIGHYEKSDKPKKEKEKKDKKIAPETWEEKNYIRKKAIEDAEKKAFLLFNIYKKAHGMPSYN
ncbi:MAG: hypothetical protein PVJ67_02080 [Candidatus Pacearchaeota archaeon]|jgi:hypothetical protein